MTEVKNGFDKQWNLHFERMIDFKRENGHCIVPHMYEQDKALGLWVSRQRVSHIKKNNMRQDRKKLLDELGFVWKGSNAFVQADMIAARIPGEDKKWHVQYEKLVEFERKYGHCIVPKEYKENKSLGNWWVNKQRRLHTNNKLRLDRKELLDELGFVWKVDDYPAAWQAAWKADMMAARVPGEDKKWHLQYEKLVEFQRKNGHCIVPKDYETDRPLGRWVSKQRSFGSKNKLRQDRKELLDEIGFVWKVVTGAARIFTTDNGSDSDPESSTKSVDPSSELPEETEPHIGQEVESQLECPSPNRKRARSRSDDSLHECGKEADQTNHGSNVARSSSSAKEAGSDREEEDSKPDPVTSSNAARISYDTIKEVVQEEATPVAYLPPGWTLQKLEPDW